MTALPSIKTLPSVRPAGSFLHAMTSRSLTERERKTNIHTYIHLNECKDTLGCFLRCFATSSGAHDCIQPGLHDATKSKKKEPNLERAKKMWQKSIFTQMTITLKILYVIMVTFSHLKSYINIPDNYIYTCLLMSCQNGSSILKKK